jgi:hypothetical protein
MREIDIEIFCLLFSVPALILLVTLIEAIIRIFWKKYP